MAIKNDRPLMRQRINITPALLAKWEFEYKFDIRNLINPSLMKESDLGTTFEHQGRTFEIVGMGEGRNIMLRETREEGTFYWETTRQFVQMKLSRFNRIYQKLPNGKTILINTDYDNNQLHLSPKNLKRKKAKSEDEEIVNENENEYDLVPLDEYETDTDTESDDDSIF